MIRLSTAPVTLFGILLFFLSLSSFIILSFSVSLACPKPVQVELHQREKESLKFVSSTAVGPSDMVLFPALTVGATYLLRLKTDLSPAAHHFKIDVCILFFSPPRSPDFE